MNRDDMLKSFEGLALARAQIDNLAKKAHEDHQYSISARINDLARKVEKIESELTDIWEEVPAS